MVLGAIGTAIRIGQIVYKIYRFQDRVIGKALRGYPRGIRYGVQHGAGIGAIAGSAIEYYKPEEPEGNIIGVPEKAQFKRPNNRQYKTRSAVRKSVRGRCYPFKR